MIPGAQLLVGRLHIDLDLDLDLGRASSAICRVGGIVGRTALSLVTVLSLVTGR